MVGLTEALPVYVQQSLAAGDRFDTRMPIQVREQSADNGFEQVDEGRLAHDSVCSSVSRRSTCSLPTDAAESVVVLGLVNSSLRCFCGVHPRAQPLARARARPLEQLRSEILQGGEPSALPETAQGIGGCTSQSKAPGTTSPPMWSACGWSVVLLDHDEERGMNDTVDTDLEVQHTIKRAALTAFFRLLRRILGPTTVHVDKGIIDGLWREEMKFTGQEAEDADLWEVDLGGGAQNSSRRNTTWRRACQCAALKAREAGNVALRALCHGKQ